jgi:hypothetical protein
MNRNDFHQHLRTGQEIPVLSASELEQLVERYPFFQTAQLLLTKAYLQNGDYRQTDQVQQAALYAGDRSALFELLKIKSNPAHTESPIESTEVKMSTEDEKVEAESLIQKNEVVVESLEAEAKDALEMSRMADLVMDEKPLAVAKAIEDQPPLLAPLPSEVSIAEASKPEEISAPVNIDPIDPALSQSILLEAIQRSLEQEIIEDVRQQRQEAGIEETSSEASLSPFAQWMQQRAKEISFDTNAPDLPSGTMPEDVQNWLRTTSEPIKSSIEERLEDLSKEESQGLIAHGARRMDVPEKKDHQKALIDRFIQKDPRITPGKAADYSISDLAKESLEDDLEFVTETMAQLFVFQGKVDRAKKAYKKLMVLHPEKSVYFATQLKNIDRIKKI